MSPNFRLPVLKHIRHRASQALAVTGTALVRRKRPDSLGAVVSAFESETASVFVRTAPRNEHLILYVLVSMLVISFGFMSVMQLDIVVSGSGRIVPVQGSIYVQSLSQAIIRDIRVKVGDVVHKGQVLANLDPTFASANLVQTQKKLASDKAQVARLEAEVNDKPYVPTVNDPDETLQANIWHQRQAEYQASVASFDAQIQNGEATLAQQQKNAEEYSKRLKLASQVETMAETLEREGWESKVKTLSVTDTRVEIERLLSDSQNQALATRQSIASLQAQRAAYIEKWHSDAGAELVTVRDDMDKTTQDLKIAQKLKDLVRITAPADAVVVKIGKASSGSVTGPSPDANAQEALFTLVPLDGPLEAEVNIDTDDAGFVKAGDSVRIKLDAYRFLHYGTAMGVIKAITESSFRVDQDTNQPVSPFVQARIRITDVHLHDVPQSFRLVPGMTIVADVVVGRRSILSYIVEGALRTGSEAMREP